MSSSRVPWPGCVDGGIGLFFGPPVVTQEFPPSERTGRLSPAGTTMMTKTARQSLVPERRRVSVDEYFVDFVYTAHMPPEGDYWPALESSGLAMTVCTGCGDCGWLARASTGDAFTTSTPRRVNGVAPRTGDGGNAWYTGLVRTPDLRLAATAVAQGHTRSCSLPVNWERTLMTVEMQEDAGIPEGVLSTLMSHGPWDGGPHLLAPQWLSDDGLMLLITGSRTQSSWNIHETTDLSSDVYLLTRAARDQPFGPPTRVDAISLAGVDEETVTMPSVETLRASACHGHAFIKHLTGDGGREIGVWSRAEVCLGQPCR